MCFLPQGKDVSEMAEVKVTDQNYEAEVEQSELPVLLDFWAPWCGPCRMLAPTIEELAKELDGKVKVGKVNVDEQPGLALKYQVMSIPMLVTMNLGMFAGKSIGVITKEEVLDLLQQAAVLRDQKVES